MKKYALLAAFVGVAGSAHAVTLWDQYTGNTNTPAFVDSEFSDFPTFNTYQVADVTVGSSWNVDSISDLFVPAASGSLAAWVTNVTQAKLNVFTKSGTLPVAANDPTAGTVVSATVSLFSTGIWEVKASGLNLNLAPGSYWIGLTPLTNFGNDGQGFHLVNSTQTGDPSAARNPGGGLLTNTAWGDYTLFSTPTAPATPGDGTLRITGNVVPEPASMAALALGAAALLRRRKK